MPTYQLTRIQEIPADIQSAWNFFTNPANLSTITPGNMGFNIISPPSEKPVYAGQLIEYRVKPLLGISMYWMTEITHLEEGRYFIDEQRYGPYALWHHQHHFRETASGVEMTDIVHFRIGMGILGRIAYHLFVKKRLADIFDYRYAKINEIFKSRA